MADITLNIRRQEKVPAWQDKAFGEFLDMLDERAEIESKKGEEKHAESN